MGIHVVKCVACKNAGAWVYIITVLLGLQGNIKKLLCMFMHNNAKKLQGKFQQHTELRIIEKTDTNNLKLAIIFVNFSHWPKPSQLQNR